MVGWRVVAVTALWALTFGCAATRSHRFAPEVACDYQRAGAAPQAQAEAAVLLIPENVEVFVPGDGGLSERKMLDYRFNWHEDYPGPARVFLMPGDQRAFVERR